MGLKDMMLRQAGSELGTTQLLAKTPRSTSQEERGGAIKAGLKRLEMGGLGKVGEGDECSRWAGWHDPGVTYFCRTE
jgi:hypothetical protein